MIHSESLARIRFPLVVVVVLVLQNTLAASVSIAGAHPDLLSDLVVGTCLGRGSRRGAVIGFAIGCVADLFAATPFGLWALVDLIVGYGLGSVSKDRLDNSRWFLPLAGGAGAGFAVVLFALAAAGVGVKGVLGVHLAVVVAVVGATSVVLVPLMMGLARWSLPPEPQGYAGAWGR